MLGGSIDHHFQHLRQRYVSHHGVSRSQGPLTGTNPSEASFVGSYGSTDARHAVSSYSHIMGQGEQSFAVPSPTFKLRMCSTGYSFEVGSSIEYVVSSEARIHGTRPANPSQVWLAQSSSRKIGVDYYPALFVVTLGLFKLTRVTSR